MNRFLEKFIRVNQTLQNICGKTAGLITLILLLVIVYDVVTRYIFNISSVALQELEWHLYSVIFLFGAGYTYLKDEHVRIDVIHSRLTAKKKLIIEIGGILLFLLPFCIVGILSSEFFVMNSIRVLETSPDGGGLPGRYILKSLIPLAFLFIALAGISRLITDIQRLKNGEEA